MDIFSYIETYIETNTGVVLLQFFLSYTKQNKTKQNKKIEFINKSVYKDKNKKHNG